MTAAGVSQTGAEPQYAALPRRVRRRLVLACLLRAALTSTLLVVVYYQLPLESREGIRIGVGLIVGLLVFAGVVAAQVWRITRSEYPLLRAVEALATTVPLFLVLFAASYYTMGQAQAGSFSETLNRTDSLYYTITIFSTVGFGDITPETQPARIVTMVQMLANLLVFGIAVRVLVNAVTVGRRSRTGTATAAAGEPGGTIQTG